LTFHDGVPAEAASLVYGNEAKTKTGTLPTCTFDPANPRFYLECSYESTAATLIKKFPPSTAMAAGLPTIDRIDCTVAK
jgi:hypothetical protein